MNLVEQAQKERLALHELLREKKGGLAWCQLYTDWADRLVQAIFEESKEGEDVQLALVATGGYGRRELSPCSDIDISLVSLGQGKTAPDAVIKRLFRGLHSIFAEGLKMHVGYSYRVPGDAPGLDGKSRTALIDARLVAGDSDCLDSLLESLWANFPTPQFSIKSFKNAKSPDGAQTIRPLPLSQI